MIWDEIRVFPVTEQRLANQGSGKWLTDIETEEIRRQWEWNNSEVEVEEDDQEIIKHNKNKQKQSEEQEVQEKLVEQEYERR